MSADELLEWLAAAEHESWVRWMRYLFSKCATHPDGSATIPPGLVARWARQTATDYADLSEQEKESDREEVRRIFPIIAAAYGQDEERGWKNSGLPHRDHDREEVEP